MTRKDYVRLAEAINKADSREEVIDNLCHVLKADNPNFNRDRFKSACEEGR